MTKNASGCGPLLLTPPLFLFYMHIPCEEEGCFATPLFHLRAGILFVQGVLCGKKKKG